MFRGHVYCTYVLFTVSFSYHYCDVMMQSLLELIKSDEAVIRLDK